MGSVYIFVATRWEARRIARVIIRRRAPVQGGDAAGVIGKTPVELILCGAGPDASGQCARRILLNGEPRQKPALVLVSGLCGALSPHLPEGALVTYSQCLAHNKEAIPVPLASTCVAPLSQSGFHCHVVKGFTDSRIAASAREKAKLFSTGAEAVDMETYAILEAAQSTGLRYAVLRAISDSAARTLPDFTPAFAPGGLTHGATAARIALSSPMRTAQLVRASRRAMKALTRGLDALFTSNELF